jgi:single-stranded DNA-specific DHH superfamily exonuclease
MIKYLQGNGKIFFDFVKGINPADKVAIITHTDLDGIASAIFAQKIVESRGYKVKFIEYVSYNKELLRAVEKKVIAAKITKLFILDFTIDSTDLGFFLKLSKKLDVLLVDHHKQIKEASNLKNIIKTETDDCCALVLFNLGSEFCNFKDLYWLLDATLYSEFSYKKQANMNLMKVRYPKLTEKNISKSKPAKLAMLISSSLIYYSENLQKVFDIVIKEDLSKLKKANEIIQKEINLWISKFKKKAEYFKEKNLYFFYFKPKYDLTSIIINTISSKNPQTTFILAVDENPEYVTIGARNQARLVDMANLVTAGIVGLKDATAGGHIPAAGARIRKKDLAKFKENILK